MIGRRHVPDHLMGNHRTCFRFLTQFHQQRVNNYDLRDEKCGHDQG